MNESHIERMKKELSELNIKIRDLNKFIHSSDIFKTLNDLEQVRMIKQAGFMESYSKILESRIWTEVNPKR